MHFKKDKKPLELMHSDVCGPMLTQSLGGTSYFVTFIDNATSKVWAYAMKSKDKTFSCFKKFVSIVETQSGKKLKALHLENGSEYIAKELKDFCATRGIKHEFTAPYTPTQNGVAKRMNRTIQERILSMLSQAGLSQGFWAEALYTTVYLINRSPNASLQFKIPEELWSGHSLSYDKLRTFGCEAYVHVPRELRANLDPKSRKCIFVGYGLDGQFGYRLWDPESRSILCSNDVVFNETKMHRKPVKEVEYHKVTFL